MEKMELDLEEYELKKNIMNNTYESLHSQASSLLLFTHQWKELEEQLDSMRDETQTRLKEIQEREKQLEAKESKVQSEANELRGLEQMIEEKRKEVTDTKNYLNSLQSLMKVLGDKERQMQRAIKEQDIRFDLKEKLIRAKEEKLNEIVKAVEGQKQEEQKLRESIREHTELEKVLGDKERQIQRAITEQGIRFDLKEKQIKAKEEKLNQIVKGIEEQKQQEQKLREERLKEEKLKEQEKSVVEVSKPLKSSEEIRKKIELKVKDHCLRKKSMEEWSCNLDLKEKQLELREKQISSKAEELDLLNERTLNEFQLMAKQLEENTEQLQVKERQLEVKSATMEKLQQECKKHLEEKERQLEVKSVTMEQMHQERDKHLETKERQLEVKSETMEKLHQECKRRLEETERQLEVKSVTMEQLHQEREKLLDTKERQLEVKSETMEKLQQECKKHLEEKEGQLEVKSVTMEQMHQQREKQLEAKERQLEEQGKELELTKKQFGSQMKVNSELLECTPAANNSASDHSKINIRDARGLQLIMYEHLKRNESVTKEISVLLQQESLEPAKLVLEAIQGFHPSNSILGNDEFDLGLIRRSCILLLQELKRITVQISPQVREEAMKLASDWKAKMTVGTESELEILGFLQLVSTYQLAAVYDANEIRGLLEKVDQQEQATQLSRAFGTTDKAPANNISVASVPTEKAVSPAEAIFSSPNHQPTAKNNIIVAPGTIGKRNRRRASFVPPNAAAIVPPNVVGAIQSFIQQKKLVKAYGRIRKFNLFHKFPPQQVLKEYVEKAMKCVEISKARKNLYEQDQVVNQGIADLRRAIDCIKAHNLESHYTSESIEKQIQELKKFMEDRRNENQKKRLCSTVDSSFQQHEHKFQRTSLSAERSSGLHPDYPNPGSFYNGQFSIPSSNYPVQFSMPANRPLGYGNPGFLLQNP